MVGPGANLGAPPIRAYLRHSKGGIVVGELLVHKPGNGWWWFAIFANEENF